MAQLSWAIPKEIPEALANILIRRISVTLSAQRTVRMDASWIPYLEGVTDASMDKPDVVEAATQLIGAITNLGPITVWDEMAV
jgi:hypothetical protein